MAELYNLYRPDRHTTPVHPPSQLTRELCSHKGAERLAAEIEEWWHRRGYPQVKAWVDGTAFVSDKGNVYTVRTNLIRGMPPKEKAP
jgi:hypothetical protein